MNLFRCTSRPIPSCILGHRIPRASAGVVKLRSPSCHINVTFRFPSRDRYNASKQTISPFHHSFIPCPSDLVCSSYVPNILSPHSTKHQLEDIVEDEVASSAIREELEGLAVVHRSLLIVDLEVKQVSQSISSSAVHVTIPREPQ